MSIKKKGSLIGQNDPNFHQPARVSTWIWTSLTSQHLSALLPMPQVAALHWILWRCRVHFWWQDLEGQFLRFCRCFCCICLELIFEKWKILLEFAISAIFHQIQDISQEISETVIQSQRWRRVLEGNGPWECQNFKRPRLAFRWALHFYRARGKRSKQRISSSLPISTRMNSGSSYF